MKSILISCSVLIICVACQSKVVIEPETNLVQEPAKDKVLNRQAESDVALRAKFWLNRAKRDSYDPIARIKAGTSLLLLARETGNHSLYPQAESILRESLLIGPGSYEALVMLSFSLSGQHRFSEAVDVAKQAVKVDPYKETAWAALGDAELEQGHLISAKSAYRKVIQIDRSLFSLTRWANLAIANGDFSLALSSLSEGAKIGLSRGVANIEVARCYIQMGDNYFQRGQFNSAETQYQKALVLWPDGYLALEHLAELRASENQLKLSNDIYSKVIKLAPHPDLLEAYAGVLKKLGKDNKAKQLYQQAYTNYLSVSERGDPSYFRHLAMFLTDKKQQPNKALIWAKKDLAIRPVPESYITLAWVLYHMGEFQSAKQMVDKALINEQSLNAIGLYHAGVIYQNSTNKKRAQYLLNKALKINPNHPNLKYIKEQLALTS